jgi:hypothetical protein
VWLTGASPSRASARHDLICVELARSSASLVTAGIQSDGWGALYAVRRGNGWILVYALRGVLSRDGSDLVTPIDTDDAVTCVHDGPPLAVFATGSSGTKIIVDDQPPQVVGPPSSVRSPLIVHASAITARRS